MTHDGRERPFFSDVDEWCLFLDENRDNLVFVAFQIAEAIEKAFNDGYALRDRGTAEQTIAQWKQDYMNKSIDDEIGAIEADRIADIDAPLNWDRRA